MKIIKIVGLLTIPFLMGGFVFHGLAKADPDVFLKANKDQLEDWGLTPRSLGLTPGALGRYFWYEVQADSLNERHSLNITVADILNPAVKLHVKKEFGLPIDEEEIEWSKKKWSANPLLEVPDKTLLEWCPNSKNDCGKIYMVRPGGDQEAALKIMGGILIPVVALHTGVIMTTEQLMDPKLVEKYKKAAGID